MLTQPSTWLVRVLGGGCQACVLNYTHLLQMLTIGAQVTAHGKQWLVVYALGKAADGDDLYLAVEPTAILPAPVLLISVPHKAATLTPATPEASPG